jgi:hypothetical protein
MTIISMIDTIQHDYSETLFNMNGYDVIMISNVAKLHMNLV